MPFLSRHRSLIVYLLLALGSVVLGAGSILKWLPFDWLEALGFISGAWGVWLQVKENVWNWPVQLVSSALYVFVFLQARLFSDTALNVLYVALYVAGWYWWLRGGERHEGVVIERTTLRAAVVLAALTAVATGAWAYFLGTVHDAAPFLDSFTTVLSLVALFMVARKLYENWWVWIFTNLIFVGLYVYKSLLLTAVLYLIFAAMSVAGLLNWRRLLREQSSVVDSLEVPGVGVKVVEDLHQ
ncbi:MAG TPA: nicotinamide riboside transporter PnuC [Candidatus Dormibacteraeota bacterium]|nr:nicotinamide riboside transporter PnuC [Candidatus Dormibacteraeota bacterium]